MITEAFDATGAPQRGVIHTISGRRQQHDSQLHSAFTTWRTPQTSALKITNSPERVCGAWPETSCTRSRLHASFRPQQYVKKNSTYPTRCDCHHHSSQWMAHSVFAPFAQSTLDTRVSKDLTRIHLPRAGIENLFKIHSNHRQPNSSQPARWSKQGVRHHVIFKVTSPQNTLHSRRETRKRDSLANRRL